MRYLALLLLTLAAQCYSQSYTAVKTSRNGVDVVVLTDVANEVEVQMVPSLGNRAISIQIHGKNILYFPYASPSEALQNPGLNGVPFLAPWANRLDESAFWANGKHFRLNAELANFQKDGNGLPIHGLLAQSSLWRVVALKSDPNAALVTSRLQFWQHPELMEQWPFAQEYEMSYILSNGTLEVKTSIVNRSAEPMPVAIGFHPYYRIPGKPRAEWSVQLPIRKAVLATQQLIPTGELKPVQFPSPLPLKDRLFDDGFTDLERDSKGLANFTIQSGPSAIHITFGPKYPVAILWEPRVRGGPEHEFFCIEPMTGPTDAVNLNHAGKYPDLQLLAPGQTWTESFWIKPTGFR